MLSVRGIEQVGTPFSPWFAESAENAASGLLTRRSTLTESVFGAYSSDTYFENYQLVDGVMIPMLVSQFSPDDGTVRKLTSVEHNAKVDQAVFAKPDK